MKFSTATQSSVQAPEPSTDYSKLHQAIQALSNVCNYASTEDGRGFSKSDADFGHQLAAQSYLTPGQAIAAYKAFRKYRGQLERMNIFWDDIPEPIRPENKAEVEKPKNTIDYADNKYIVTFKFDWTLKDAVKAIYGAQFNPKDKNWLVPASSYDQLVKVAEEYGFVWLTDEKAGLSANPGPSRLIELEDETFYIRMEYEPKMNGEVSHIMGRKWDSKKLMWSAPWSAAAQVKEFGDKWGFTYQDGLLEKLNEKVQELQVSMEASSAEDADFEVNTKLQPRPYQRAGAKYIVGKKRALLADDMGLGKTAQSIMAIQHENAFPAIVICPASVKINWQREINMWIDASSYIINGRATAATLHLLEKFTKNGIPTEPNDLLSFLGETNSDDWDEYQSLGDYKALLNKPSVIIINYDILKDWYPYLKTIGFKAMICDESAALKNGQTKRTKVVGQLAKDIEYRFLLSGTPMLNRPSELISQLQILDRLQEFGGWKYFSTHFCEGYHDGYGYNTNGASNTDELGKLLRTNCMVRRTKEEVLKELPDKQRSFVYLSLDNKKEYNKAEKDIITWVGEQALKDEEFKASISHLPLDQQQTLLANYARSAEQRTARAEHLVKIEKLKTLSALGKLEAVNEWIESFLATGEKLVVFGWHKSVVEAIATRFNAPSITGDTTQVKRQQYIDSFQNDPNTKLLVLNIKAGGVGITLTAASNVALVELGWTPGDMHQAEDRCHRLGQKNAVNCWYMLGQDTIDIDINDLLQEKSQVITSIVGGQELTPDETSMLSDLTERIKKRHNND